MQVTTNTYVPEGGTRYRAQMETKLWGRLGRGLLVSWDGPVAKLSLRLTPHILGWAFRNESFPYFFFCGLLNFRTLLSIFVSRYQAPLDGPMSFFFICVHLIGVLFVALVPWCPCSDTHPLTPLQQRVGFIGLVVSLLLGYIFEQYGLLHSVIWSS